MRNRKKRSKLTLTTESIRTLSLDTRELVRVAGGEPSEDTVGTHRSCSFPTTSTGWDP